MTEELQSAEGWFVSHLYYHIDRSAWHELSEDRQSAARRDFTDILGRFADHRHRQAYCYAVWGHKADLGVLLVDPDLQHLNQAENQLLSSLTPGILCPTYSFTSMSEISEYTSDESDYDRNLRENEGLAADSEQYKQKMEAFRKRMRHYIEERLYPRLPEHKVISFYPMNKRRAVGANWYGLGFGDRKKMMASHMITGRKYAGKVKQLVTGSVGLDAWEWGVTLFADDPVELKKIVYEMRYDEVSAVYAEFGDFLIGIRLSPEALFRRLCLQAAGPPAGSDD